MRKITISDRLLLLLTGLMAAYQIVVGVDNLTTLPMISYTVGFGVLLVAGLLMIILGFEILGKPMGRGDCHHHPVELIFGAGLAIPGCMADSISGFYPGRVCVGDLYTHRS